MRITISAEQRDALYDQILDRLTGIGDIEIAIQTGKFETAERLSQEFSDDLQLLFNDLGFGEAEGSEPTELTSSPDVLGRALPRLRDLAAGHSASHEAEFAEIRLIRDRSRLIGEACESVLDELGGTAEPSVKARSPGKASRR
jgi:hypothetical protein